MLILVAHVLALPLYESLLNHVVLCYEEYRYIPDSYSDDPWKFASTSCVKVRCELRNSQKFSSDITRFDSLRSSKEKKSLA